MIDPEYYGLVEIIVGGVIVLGFGFWQLWDLKREKRKREADDDRERRD